MKILIICTVIASAMFLTACEEDTDVTRHVPGVYMGEQDPLLSSGASSLNERFMTVQSDR